MREQIRVAGKLYEWNGSAWIPSSVAASNESRIIADIRCTKCNGRTHPMWPTSMVREEYLCDNCIDRSILAQPGEYMQMMRTRDAAQAGRAGSARMNIYVASSWRNSLQPAIVSILRSLGHEVYDFKNPAPGNTGFAWSEIDPDWQNWTPAQWCEALKHPVAERGYRFDIEAVRRCDACVYVLPCGKSASFELGYIMGMGKKGYVVALDKTEPELMFKEATIITSMPELFETFGGGKSDSATPPPRNGAMKVVWYCEDDFAGSTDVADENEFHAFERGFGAGAAEYGGGKWNVYLLPRDHDKMVEEEHVGEVMRAIESVDATQHSETP